MKKAILIQARLSSKRFPGKMMRLLGGMPLVEFVYKRCLESKMPDITAVLTSDSPSDDELFRYCVSRGIPVFRGELENVLKRYVEGAEAYKAGAICRVCGDSPFVDTAFIDTMFERLDEEGLDYVSPDKSYCVAGLDSEVMTLEALKRSIAGAQSADELEHVTLYIKNHPQLFKTGIFRAGSRLPVLKKVSLTVDYPDDLVLCEKVLSVLGPAFDFKSENVIEALSKEVKN